MSLNPLAVHLRPLASRHITSASRAAAFSSTSVSHAGKTSRDKTQTTSYEYAVPPESPQYIRFPKPPQSDETKAPRVRGHLPQPREIFTKAEGQRKIEQAFLDLTAPQRRDPKPRSKVDAGKKKLADYRRRNLQAGLQTLWQRKSQRDSARRGKAAVEEELIAKMRAAPEAKEDVMTRSTVHSSILDVAVQPDPDRFANTDRSRTKVALKEMAKREARRDALMELYINASGFIVTEAELKEEVERIFTEDYFSKQSQAAGTYGAPENIWGVQGKPMYSKDMADKMGSAPDSTADLSANRDNENADRAARRQKRIAEEFTGGKMDQ